MTQKWTYARPSALLVRDAQTGFPREVATTTIPQDLHPHVWFTEGNPYWQYNQFVTKHLVLAFLQKQPLKEKELRRLASYILAFTQHVAIMGWVFNPDPKERGEVYRHNSRLIRKLKAIRAREPFMHEYVQEMLDECMKYAVDPL